MKQLLIKEDFFPSEIVINKKDIYPMVVMATMSSGKSTLVNALLGEPLLPSKNSACTAKKYSILDDDSQTECEAYITYNTGFTEVIREDVSAKLMEINENDNVEEILIRSHVNGIINSDRTLLIIDTPGPNNSRNETHKEVSEKVLDKIVGGMLLYVINATQFGINDDKEYLDYICRFCKMHKDMEILFVINKIDEFDEERGESIENLIFDVEKYLDKIGFTNPNIIPVSSLSALVLKKALNNVALSRFETRFFKEAYDLFKPDEHDLRTYSITYDNPDQLKKVTIDNEEYRVGSIKQAIEKTGISQVEEFIQKAQIKSGYQSNNYINIKR